MLLSCFKSNNNPISRVLRAKYFLAEGVIRLSGFWGEGEGGGSMGENCVVEKSGVWGKLV